MEPAELLRSLGSRIGIELVPDADYRAGSSSGPEAAAPAAAPDAAPLPGGFLQV